MASLKDLRKMVSNIDALSEKIKSTTPQAPGANDRYWKPTRDKSGNGYAVIRFLPAPNGEDMPFIMKWSHSFQHPNTGKYYIEDSRTTINEKDPVGEYNQKIWATGLQSHQEFVKKYSKRRLHYIANILVINDSANPENNGKVFLYDFGKKIYNKINSAMNPEFPDDPRINPFDPWEGANFKLKIKTVDKFPNYDASEFDNVSAIGTDEEIERIWKSEYSLKEIIDPKNFKSYDQLLKRFNAVMGFEDTTTSPATPPTTPASRPAAAPAAKVEEDVPFDVDTAGSEGEDDGEFIARLRSQLSDD